MAVKLLIIWTVLGTVGADTLFFQPHETDVKIEESSSSSGLVVCPGGQQECPSDYTCCPLLTAGQFGCCPLKKAVCCKDHLHCCPSGSTCDTGKGKCMHGSLSVPWVRKINASPTAAASVRNVICPSGLSSCPAGSTCCMTKSFKYACCPLPRAVCCADHLHCCPSGTTCDVAAGRCNRDSVAVPWVKKTPASPVSAKSGVICPGGTSSCPTGSTCCQLQSGQYGCCPIPNAVCCADHLHCCPSGTTCDVAAGRCNRDSVAVPWVKKTPASPVSAKSGVICPGGTSSCPTGSTCCQLQSGQYGCCPIPNAVCCADHLHCCPSGTTCDVAAGRCNRDSVAVPWVKKTPASPVSAKSGVICPGGTSSCPTGSTCCQLQSGKYACCPLPNAVCCADHLHCCPSGTTCDVAAGRCNRDSVAVPWVKKTPASPVSAKSGVICPGGTSSCPTGSTCCQLQSGQYGCCPIPNAVCCADHLHCCPSGTTCDVAAGRCNRDSVAVPWVKKTPASPVSAKSGVICPGGTSSCPTGSTCCQLQSGKYACCPLPNAVCCADHLHCCPSGTTCDVAAGRCNRDSMAVPWVKKTPASPVSAKSGVICPGGTSSCPTGSTCCQLQSGQYGCCPIPNAVCCADHLHCCPSGTTCDVAVGRCNRDSVAVPWVKKTPASPVSAKSGVICPGGTSSCPTGSTCCQLQSGKYACCPLPNAVCCADHLHCCPSGTTCDVAVGRCNRDSVAVPWVKKTLASPVSAKSNVICPGGKSTCPTGSTCCPMQSGQYGCCPLPNADCCADHLHCCPSGTICDSATGQCFRGSVSVPWASQTAALKVPDSNAKGASSSMLPSVLNLQDVVCPDKQSTCPVGSTCCKTSSGQYGCCPLPDAVCCADLIHCCPSGTKCNTALGKCMRGAELSSWVEKTPAQSVARAKQNNILCPDRFTHCPAGSTCCFLQTYQYVCCPLPKAVCCPDGIHCCPEASSCDMVHGTCKRVNGESVAWSEKKPPLPGYAVSANQPVICPDGKSQCPSGKSCCKLASGEYGCCPFPQGSICCSDHLHCCPKGYRCNLVKNVCEKGNFRVSFEKAKTTASISVHSGSEPAVTSDLVTANIVMCPDHQYMCPDNNTCCRMDSGHWGCCPLPRAVCCKDNIHCCPEGSQCDLVQQACVSDGNPATKWAAVTAVPHKMESVERKSVTCPGGQFSCPSDTTCCKMKTGQWACCPLAEAVCCKDGIHCCPKSYTCDLKTAACTHQGSWLPWLLKQPASEVNPQEESSLEFTPLLRKLPAKTRITTDMLQKPEDDMVICPDKTSMCPEGSTCCQLPDRSWGCCPLPKAVCCSDHIHCCPYGATCDLSTGRCLTAGGQLSFSYSRLSHSLSAKKGDLLTRPSVGVASAVRLGSVICPDHQHECKDGNTCCLMKSGEWGCCPYTDAVCCPDGEYCCPNGYVCHLTMCIRGNKKLPGLKRRAALLKRPLQ